MSARHFLDTSVLLYAIGKDRDETAKGERAIALLLLRPAVEFRMIRSGV